MKNKKNNAVVFGFTNNFTFAVACVMMDIKKFSPGWVDEIVIISDGIKESQKKLLNSILPCRFIDYDFPIKGNFKFNKSILNYFSKLVFSKFECFRLLEDYKNVVWLDYDIVITQDISELTDYCESGIKMMLSEHDVLGQLSSPVKDYNMALSGISSGTFVFQDHLPNYIDKYNFCYNSTQKYAEYLKYPEQAIFDFMIQNFNIDIYKDLLDKDIWCVHPRELDKLKNAKIIHTGGQAKFWNELNNSQWNENYKNWLKMGGVKYNLNKYKFKKLVTRLLRNIGFYDVFKKIFINFKNYFIKIFD